MYYMCMYVYMYMGSQGVTSDGVYGCNVYPLQSLIGVVHYFTLTVLVPWAYIYVRGVYVITLLNDVFHNLRTTR